MTPELKEQMRNLDSANGDRIDPVANLCRRAFLRVELCPCENTKCVQCEYDLAAIELAWEANK